MKKDANAGLREAIRSIVKAVMTEAPNLMNVDSEVSMDAVKDPAQDLAMEMSIEFIHTFDAKFEKTFIDILNQNLVGLTPDAAPGWTREVLRDTEEMIEGQRQELFMMCADKIVEALVEYAVESASLVAVYAHEGVGEDG